LLAFSGDYSNTVNLELRQVILILGEEFVGHILDFPQ